MYCSFPYVCFLFLRWVKFCSGCCRQVVFLYGRVIQVVVLYSNDFMEIGLGGLNIGHLRWGSSYRGGRLNRFDCTFQMDAKFARLWKIVKSFSFVTKMVSSVKNHKNLQFSWLCMYLLLPHWIEYHQILHGGVWHMWSCNL